MKKFIFVYTIFSSSLLLASERDLALQSMVAMINSITPKMLDDDTRLDKADLDNSTVVHYYTLINHDYTQIAANWFDEHLKPNLLSNVCGQAKLALFMTKFDAVMQYRYTSKDGYYLGAVNVDSKQC